MLIIVALSAAGILLFVIGISFAFHGYRSIPNTGTMVARIDFETLKRNFNISKESEEKLRSELAATQAELTAVKENFQSTQKTIENTHRQLEKIKADSEDLISRRAAEIQEFKAQIDGLEAENHILKKEGEDEKNKARAAESELASIREAAAIQAKGAIDLIESLKKEIETLKNNTAGAETFKTQLDTVKSQLGQCQAENKSLNEKVEQDGVRIKQLLDATTMLKGDYERQIDELVKTIENFRSENEALKTNKIQDGESARLKELNEQLVQREKDAQYELAKSRAQAIGLGKICEDFKAKFEDIEQLKEDLRRAKAKLILLEQENAEMRKAKNSPSA